MPHPHLSDAGRPRVIAHRGFVPAELASQGIAENTHAAFTAARDAGARYLESDCHIAGDGAVVLAHDEDLARVAGDPRLIAETPLAELRAIMADRGGLLTLDEALEAFPDARFNLDVKVEAAADDVGRIVSRHSARVLLASFDGDSRLRALRAAETANRTRAEAAGRAPDAPVRPATSADRGALIRILLAAATRSRARIERAIRDFDALQVPERWRGMRVLTPALLAAAHANGVEVHVWTVNDPERMRLLAARGVDGIITDRADLALANLI